MPCFLQTLYTFAPANSTRGVAQLVSAPRSGRGGRKFESSHPDINKSDNSMDCRSCFLLLLAVVYFFLSHLSLRINMNTISAIIAANCVNITMAI